jgi:hypothetical protein
VAGEADGASVFQWRHLQGNARAAKPNLSSGSPTGGRTLQLLLDPGAVAAGEFFREAQRAAAWNCDAGDAVSEAENVAARFGIADEGERDGAGSDLKLVRRSIQVTNSTCRADTR